MTKGIYKKLGSNKKLLPKQADIKPPKGQK